MSNGYLRVEPSERLSGTIDLYGAKNAVLVSMASLLLTDGKSTLSNVPFSSDVYQMIKLLEDLGVKVLVDEEGKSLEVDTTGLANWHVTHEIMNKMRASILVMGPLLARFKKSRVALPGGCNIGARRIDMHLKGFRTMGVRIEEDGHFLRAEVVGDTKNHRIVLEYPSVGATENLMLYAALKDGLTTIVNASLEPEVLNLIEALKKMGATIWCDFPQTIHIEGASSLKPIHHAVVPDRLEAGILLFATALVGGEINITNANGHHLDIVLEKLREMGHFVEVGPQGRGVWLKSTPEPKAVDFKTGPYPSFPTDLQSPMMALQCLAQGTSVITETVFENRMMHVIELRKMGAQISVDGNIATVLGVDDLYGASVIASDIRASCALVIAGLAAVGTTVVSGLHHWMRAYDSLEKKLALLGASIAITEDSSDDVTHLKPHSKKIRVPLERVS
jgi:UDP-N-acetylglucosamine 1-carboxyvinyltransferase